MSYSSCARQTRSQCDIRQEVTTVYAHGRRARSGRIKAHLQSAESAEDASYCRMRLSQSRKASECRVVTVHLRCKIIKARVSNPNRMQNLQLCNCQCYKAYRGRRSPKHSHTLTAQSPIRVPTAPSAPSRRSVNGQQDQIVVETLAANSSPADPSANNGRGPTSQEIIMKKNSRIQPP